MNPHIVRKKQFISQAQCVELNTWVNLAITNKWLDLGRGENASWNMNSRLTTRQYGHRFEYPQIVHDVFTLITEALELHDLDKSIAGGGRDGIVVSCTYTNGDVYEHTDPMEGERHVLRCNIMSQKAELGADLYIGNKHIDVEVGELHCYLPSDVPHYVTTAKGRTPRIMWMFGYQCSKDRFKRLISSPAKAGFFTSEIYGT
jgi:hypothetical protein